MPFGIVALTYSIYLPVASSSRWALPISEPEGLFAPRPSSITSSSILLSSSSGSLNPSEEKNFMPLSSYGLCDADITIPASSLKALVRKATPGVGIGPTNITFMPIEQIPDVSALSII